MRSRASLVFSLGAVVATGCHEPVTEVVLVITSDLVVPNDVNSISVSAQFGTAVLGNSNDDFNSGPFQLRGFPASVGFVSSQNGTSVFSIAVELDRLDSLSDQTLVVRRTIDGIQFTRDETRMLVVPLSKVCSCMGTSCPNPGNPACDDISSPPTVPFDPAVAPPSSSPSQVTVFQPGGGGVDTGRPFPPTVDAGGRPPLQDGSVIGSDARPGAIDANAGTGDSSPGDGAGDARAGSVDGAAGDLGGGDGGAAEGGPSDGGPADGGRRDGGPGDGATDLTASDS